MTIDIDKFVQNIEEIKKRFGNIMLVVKANAYGHGMRTISKIAEELNIWGFMVAFLEEGAILRKEGIRKPILISNFVEPSKVEEALELDLSITIYSEDQLDALESVVSSKERLKVHLFVDTGMGGLGTDIERALILAKRLANSGFRFEGVYSHFSSADIPEDPYNEYQFKRFEDFIKALRTSGISYEIAHMFNSPALISLQHHSHFDLSRVGIIAYGLQPSEFFKVEWIKPILEWKSKVVHLRWLEEGEFVSYGKTYKTLRKTLVGVVPVGYGDGLNRRLSNVGDVLIEGKRARIIGRVCMDQIMVDLTDVEGVKIGSEVVIIGRQGEEAVCAEEIAKKVGTINYEVTTGISWRVPRVFHKDGKIVKVEEGMWLDAT